VVLDILCAKATREIFCPKDSTMTYPSIMLLWSSDLSYRFELESGMVL